MEGNGAVDIGVGRFFWADYRRRGRDKRVRRGSADAKSLLDLNPEVPWLPVSIAVAPCFEPDFRGFTAASGCSGGGKGNELPNSSKMRGIQSGLKMSLLITGLLRRRWTLFWTPWMLAGVTSATFLEFNPGRHLHTSTPWKFDTKRWRASVEQKLMNA